MATEYLVVLFARKRRVMINDEFMGFTNTKFELAGGLYEVTLGPPMNFTPDKCNIDLHNTSSLMPMTIVFKESEK